MKNNIVKILLLSVLFASQCIKLQAADFAGKIGRTEAESTPAWPAQPKAPDGAPNILIWLIDDAGFGQLGSYGGLTETKTLDQLASEGLQFTNFHATPLCSPSRAALLSGRNPHNVGMGAHAITATGYPGYNARIPKSAASIAQILKDSGYGTYALGKWDHMPAEHMSESGPFDYWPSGQGFEHFYGFLLHEANQFNPTLWRDHTPVTDADLNNPNYHLTEDLADQAIFYLRQQQALAPAKPFFMYWATGAVHSPHHAPEKYLEKYRGKFDMGWNEARQIILERQKKLGVVPRDAELPTWPNDVPAWNTLSADEKKMASRMMEAFAAMLDHADEQFGRLLSALDEMGKLDNTIVVVLSDNGASAEGGLEGAYNEMLLGKVGWQENLKYFDKWGGPETYPHYPVGWAAAGNTPFRYYKQSAFEGGNRVPLIIHWPNGIKHHGEYRNQYHFISDVVPSLLQMAEITPPKSVAGVAQKPMDGTSFSYAFDDADAPNRKHVQYYELWGNRGIWADGWKANIQIRPKPWEIGTNKLSVDAVPWELYNLNQDFNERHNLATELPEKLKEMQALFDQEAKKNQVYPLAPDYMKAAMQRLMDNLESRDNVFTYDQSITRIPAMMAPPVNYLPFELNITLNNEDDVKQGVIFSLGGDGAGLAMYLQDGKPILAHNHMLHPLTELKSSDAIPTGIVHLKATFKRKGRSSDADVTLNMEDKVVASGKLIGLSDMFPLEESFDVGVDYASPVIAGYPARQPLPDDFIKQVKFEFDIPLLMKMFMFFKL